MNLVFLLKWTHLCHTQLSSPNSTHPPPQYCSRKLKSLCTSLSCSLCLGFHRYCSLGQKNKNKKNTRWSREGNCLYNLLHHQVITVFIHLSLIPVNYKPPHDCNEQGCYFNICHHFILRQDRANYSASGQFDCLTYNALSWIYTSGVAIIFSVKM